MCDYEMILELHKWEYIISNSRNLELYEWAMFDRAEQAFNSFI